MDELPTRTAIYNKYREIAEIDSRRIELQMKVTELTGKIIELQKDLGDLVAMANHGIKVGSRVTVIWTPTDRQGKTVAKVEAFTGTVIMCRCPNPVSDLEVVVETLTRSGNKDIKSFFPGGREYTFTVLDAPEQ